MTISNKFKIFPTLSILLIFLLANTVFGAEQPNATQIPVTQTQPQTRVTPKKKKSKKIAMLDPDYFMVGMNFYYIKQDAFTDPPKFDNDVHFFAYELSAEFQYLFKSVMLKINFDYSNFNTTAHFKNTSGTNYTESIKWKRRLINFNFGYCHEFNKKYLLVFPAIGFGYERYENHPTEHDHIIELYYLIIDTRFYINVSSHFSIGFNLDFRILLSHMSRIYDPTLGEGRTQLQKGFFFYLRVPMKFNLSKTFFVSLIPWFGFFRSPEHSTTTYYLKSGTKVSGTYHQLHIYTVGAKVMLGVYF